jgi:HEAT repeat protein
LYYQMMTASSSDRIEWRLEELHPKMVPTWLAAAGYLPEPKQARERDTSRPVYAAVPLLATLRQTGELDELDEIADDERQTAGTRLTCVMALFRAGEKLKTPVLMSIASGDRNLERRLVAILALRYSEDRQTGAALVKLLDDENAEVRTAAICALAGPMPPQAVPKLKKAIDDLDPPQAMLFIFEVLGKYKSREACEALAGFLAAGLEDKRKTEHLRNAISALEAATGQRFGAADARTDADYRAKAQVALAWWKDEGRRTLE